MAHVTVSVEYGIHSLLWLVDTHGAAVSSRELAELTGVSPSYVAKILSKLEKAGVVQATEGLRGGYLLAKPPERITFLEIVDAIEGRKPLFDCQEVRTRCPLFGDSPPRWATKGVCSIHAVMLHAEKSMRETLAGYTLADVAKTVGRKAPPQFFDEVQSWIQDRAAARGARQDSNADR